LENIDSKLSQFNNKGTDKHASIAEMQNFFSLLLEKYNDQKIEYEQTQHDFLQQPTIDNISEITKLRGKNTKP